MMPKQPASAHVNPKAHAAPPQPMNLPIIATPSITATPTNLRTQPLCHCTTPANSYNNLSHHSLHLTRFTPRVIVSSLGGPNIPQAGPKTRGAREERRYRRDQPVAQRIDTRREE